MAEWFDSEEMQKEKANEWMKENEAKKMGQLDLIYSSKKGWAVSTNVKLPEGSDLSTLIELMCAVIGSLQTIDDAALKVALLISRQVPINESEK